MIWDISKKKKEDFERASKEVTPEVVAEFKQGEEYMHDVVVRAVTRLKDLEDKDIEIKTARTKETLAQAGAGHGLMEHLNIILEKAPEDMSDRQLADVAVTKIMAEIIDILIHEGAERLGTIHAEANNGKA